MSSSRLQKPERVTDTIADAFLLKIVNLEWPPKDTLLRHRLFSRMLPTVGISLSNGSLGKAYLTQVTFDLDTLSLDWLHTWRGKLREAWMEKPARVRRDRLRSIIHAYVGLKVGSGRAVMKVPPADVSRLGPIAQAVAAAGGNVVQPDVGAESVLREPPTDSADTIHDPFLQVLFRALEKAKWMRLCRNRDCRHPFFVATKRTDKYCSQECARPAKRAAKLRWWKRHGRAWRAARKQKSKRKGGK